jgi:hypothetical protein
MRYPFQNELFFSHNCNCHDDYLFANEVVCRASVAFFSGPDESRAELK